MYIYTKEYYSVKRKSAIMPSAATTRMDPEMVILSEGSQTEKEK